MTNTDVLEFLVRIFFNSFLIFICSLLIIESALYFLRIKNTRVRAIMRCIPLLKLPLDLFIYKMMAWDGLGHFYLFGCKGFVKKMLVYALPGFFPLNVESHSFPSVSTVIFTHVSTQTLTLFLICLLAVSTVLMIRKAYLIYQSFNYIKELKNSSIVCLRPIFNLKLLTMISRVRARIYQSAEIQIPFAATNLTIFIPKEMVKKLSQNEFEAVIAHELEHLKWKDSWMRLACEITCSLFWWIPTSWFMKKIEEEQEQACDASMFAYQIDKEALMNAIYKVVKHHKNAGVLKYAHCSFKSRPCSYIRRFRKIVEDDVNQIKSCFTADLSLIAISILILSMRFCIC